MILVKFNGKTYACDVRVSGRYEDNVQIDGLEATCSDGLPVNETTIEKLVDVLHDRYADELYELWYDRQIGAAEYYAELMQDQ